MSQKIWPALDVLARNPEIGAPFRAKNCALLFNPTAVTREGRDALEIFRAQNFQISRLFSPEHGPRADLEGDVENSQLENLPIFSLYGATRRPTPQMLDGLDAIFCDLQDVGARFYTYGATIIHVLEEALPREIEVVILDRPNPLGGLAIEGPLVTPESRSFIGYAPFPVIHGLTMGEMARFFARWKGLDERFLRVIEVENWRRAQKWNETELNWVQPSPNLPDFRTAQWYPGLSLLEFSGLSVGRGTDAPFQILAAPWLESEKFCEAFSQFSGEKIEMETSQIVPTRATFEGENCRAIRFQTEKGAPDFPVRFGLNVMAALRASHPDFSRVLWDKSAQLVGSRAVTDAIWDGELEMALEMARLDAEKFALERAEFLIYG